jgi:predicted flap endonuclease-1-like 5' DNA nuclease
MDVSVTQFITYLFMLLSGFILGYWLFYRDRSHEESARGRLKKENHDLRRSLQASQVACESLEEKFGRQRGQLNVLQQLCDDWGSSREIAARERAQLETDLSAKSSRVSEMEREYREEKQKRIALEDKVHKLTQEVLEKKAEVEEQWRSKHQKAETALSKRTNDLEAVKSARKQVTSQLHTANARIAELEAEITSNKSLIETATSNATGLKQEYVSLETGLQATNDQLKRARADIAKVTSEKEIAIKATAEAEKQLAVLEQDAKKLDEQTKKLQQKLETTQQALTATQEQLARVTEQRDQAMEHEKAAGVITSGLQKRLDNQESTIHMLRQSQDDALENLKHELKVRNELETRFDARAESIRAEAEQMKADYEAQIEALRENAEGIKVNRIAEYDSQLQELRGQLQVKATRCGELESEASTFTESIVKLDGKREQLQQELEVARQQMQAQLKQDSETIGNLQRERDDLRGEIEHLQSLMAELQQQISTHTAYGNELELKENRVAELENALSQRTMESDELLGRFNELRDQLATHSRFTTELEMSQSRVVELERSLSQKDQESKRLQAQANELERLRQRYQDARDRQDSLQVQLDELVSRQISSESERGNLVARISELEARLKAANDIIEDLRRERALVLATLADQRQAQEPEATIISFTQSMVPTEPEAEVEVDDDYDAEYGGRVRRDANRGVVYTEAPESCDDLKRISGIAEVLEKRLNDFGIYTFKQILDWKPVEIEEFSRLLAFRDRIERDDWQGQARFFYNQKRQGVRSVA